MTNLDSFLISRDITLPAKVHLVKAMVFPVVMCGCEIWTIKKAENWRMDAFELWCWRRLLRVPWTAGRSNQSILKEINPEYSLEGLMVKLNLQYFGHLMWRTDSLEKTLMLGKIESRRRRGRQRWDGWMASPSGWTRVWASSRSWLMDREAWPSAAHGVAKSQTQLSDWTTTTDYVTGINIYPLDRICHMADSQCLLNAEEGSIDGKEKKGRKGGKNKGRKDSLSGWTF